MSRLAWVTGAAGLIGGHLVRACPSGWNARGLTRGDLELTDGSAVRRAFDAERPGLIIHCAALSKTPACEANPGLARRSNVEVTRLLAELAQAIPLLFLSTDLVFDGRKGNYTETDEVSPLNVYAETKVAAERIILGNPLHSVVRTSLNVGTTPGGTAFNEQWRAAWQRGETTRLFVDEFRSPIAAEVTARAVWELVEANKPGCYHIAGAERLSRFEIGQLLARRSPALQPRIEPFSIAEFPGPRRAPDTTLDSSKAQALLSFPLPRFSEWLDDHPEVPL
jgi:dTDP-4-dehydrorhamnose reductase